MAEQPEKNNDRSAGKEITDSGSRTGAVALTVGIVSLLVPILGMFLGVIAAVMGNTVRKRALAGHLVNQRELRLAGYGIVFGMAAILLNIVLSIAYLVYTLIK